MNNQVWYHGLDIENSERVDEKNFLNGDLYLGNFKGVLPYGQGKYTWSDGTVYEGDWEEGKLTGKGHMFWSSGAKYEGDFSGSYFHGFGTYNRSDGSIYTGAWRMNIQHGLGRKQYANFDTYEGLWKEGVHEGSGRYAWTTGDTYIGNWKGGKIWGRGVMRWANGDLFAGFWMDGFRHGSGSYRFSNGGCYFGTWSKGLRDGNGTYYPPGNKHPSLRNWCNSVVDDYKRSVLSRSSLQSEESRDQKPNVICSFFAKEFLSPDKLSLLSHMSNEDEHVQKNIVSVCEREYVQGVLIKERDASSANMFKIRKLESKFFGREASASSYLGIFGGGRSHYLMLNLQLGIRYTVGKITPVPMRDVLSSDFGDRARVSMYFPKKGSQLTPPHYSIDFYWKDYSPMVFRNLREMFKLDAADYMLSICGDDGLRNFASPGKSGSIFYLSRDGRFVIKTLKGSEVKALVEMLPEYYNHVKKHDNTLITKFFGLHQITLKHGKKVRFVVMGNMFCTELSIHRRYDLKGSTLGRYTDPRKISDNTTLKDLDLSYVFHMDKLLHESLFKQISLDCEFLESQQIIDYSLLLGLHVRAPKNLKAINESSLVADGAMSCGESLNSSNGILLVTHEPRHSNSLLRGSHIRGSPLRAFSLGHQEVDLLVPGTGRLPVQLGVNMPAQARHKAPQDVVSSSVSQVEEPLEVYDVVLYLGMIDVLQKYTVEKKFEHFYKTLRFDPLSISVVEPNIYAKRFINYLERVFTHQP